MPFMLIFLRAYKYRYVCTLQSSRTAVFCVSWRKGVGEDVLIIRVGTFILNLHLSLKIELASQAKCKRWWGMKSKARVSVLIELNCSHVHQFLGMIKSWSTFLYSCTYVFLHLFKWSFITALHAQDACPCAFY